MTISVETCKNIKKGSGNESILHCNISKPQEKATVNLFGKCTL